MFVTSAAYAAEAYARVGAQRRDRIALLLGIASGEIDPQSLANAAVWYMRAALALEQFDPALAATIEAFAKDRAAEPDEEVALALVDAQPIVDLVRQASWLQLCDFASYRGVMAGVFRRYQHDMYDLERLIEADARRLTHAGDQAGAADRLAIAYRMCAHLAQDGTLVSSALADAMFDRASSIAERANERTAFGVDECKALVAAIERNDVHDTFGYDRALTATRHDLMMWVAQDHRPSHALLERVQSFLNECDGEMLALLLLARDRDWHAIHGAADASMKPPGWKACCSCRCSRWPPPCPMSFGSRLRLATGRVSLRSKRPRPSRSIAECALLDHVFAMHWNNGRRRLPNPREGSDVQSRRPTSARLRVHRHDREPAAAVEG